MTEAFRQQLLRGAAALSVDLSEQQLHQFFTYYEMLAETNKVMNLTAITEESEVVQKHFIDCLAITKAVIGNVNVSRETFSGRRLIDVGTGAGFPGMVLKIAFPELDVILTDSLKKRLSFLEQVIEALELKGIRTIHGRAEDLAHQKELREQFDFCTSRAVANLSTLSEYDLPFVRVGGYFIAYKSSDILQESKEAENAIRLLGGVLEQNVEYQLPESEIGRSILSIKKLKSTPKLYPRKAGTPAKKPL